MARTLVTGANGFIGTHLVRELVSRGHEVNGLVRSTSDLSGLQGLPVRLFVGDVRDPAALALPLQSVDYVFHLAAELMGTDRAAFMTANADGTANMLAAAEQHAGHSLKRFLYVSSQAAAGPGSDATPFTEAAPRQPISWYGLSKKRAEEHVLAFAPRLPVTIVRPSSVYGDREREISQVFGLVQMRIQPQLGIRTRYVVLVFVRDLVDAMIAAAESPGTLGQVYFLNHPEILRTRDVVRGIATAMGKPAGLRVPVPMLLLRLAAPFAELVHHFDRARPRLTRDKVREVSERFWIADPSKARRDFGWQAANDVVRGMRPTVAAFERAEAELDAMPREDRGIRWLKYVACAVLLGALIENAAYIGRFYQFHPPWLVFGIVFGAFGLGLGTLAMLLRQAGRLAQFVSGTAVATLVEILNDQRLIPRAYWDFAPAWPLGITNGWLRSLVLGMAGGLFVIAVHALARQLYKLRLRIG